jgi:hypothetical protein
VSAETEAYLAEMEEAEARAAGLLEEAGPDGEGLNGRASPVISTMRRVLKKHKKEIDRIREEARTEAREELIRERKTEAAYRRLGVPDGPARALFNEIDPTDDAAMAARAAELRGLGISWAGQPAPPAAPAQPDVAAVQAMQMAAAGAGSPEPWDARMRRMAADPGAFSDKERNDVVQEFNKAVRSADQPHSSGAIG